MRKQKIRIIANCGMIYAVRVYDIFLSVYGLLRAAEIARRLSDSHIYALQKSSGGGMGGRWKIFNHMYSMFLTKWDPIFVVLEC